MNKKILLSNMYFGEPLDIIKKAIPQGFDLLMIEELTHESLLATVKNVDYLLVSGRLKITKDILQNGQRLKMIQRTGVGLDTLDLKTIKEMHIPLYVNQGINAESVAEHALLLILASLRRLTEIDFNTKSGIWKKQQQGMQTHELKGKTVGIIGMGNIAKTLVKLLEPFKVNILYYDQMCLPFEEETKHNLKCVELDRLLAEADIISLHCALTDQTKGMINKSSIAKMKDGVVIVNTARGQIINAFDLAEALHSGKVAFAGIDVHEQEPFDEDYILKQFKNVILTPHIAGITYESFAQMMNSAMRNIYLFDSGRLSEIEQYRYL